MNIFVVDEDPIKAAQSLCDAHVVKMIVESCQLLSTQDRLDGHNEGRYKMTHVNHPCRKCLTNTWNRYWLKLHLLGLLEEYRYRYGKEHKCTQMFDELWASGTTDLASLSRLWYSLTSFPQCMPEEFKGSLPVPAEIVVPSIYLNVAAYRRYYRYKAQTLKRFKYTKREPPEWLEGE